MAKYIYVYRGPATPMEDFTPEQGAEQLAAWTAWMERVGSALVDGGAPFGQSVGIVDDGTRTTAGDQTGYSILEADSLEAATVHTEGHPFLTEGKGRFVIDVHELMPM